MLTDLSKSVEKTEKGPSHQVGSECPSLLVTSLLYQNSETYWLVLRQSKKEDFKEVLARVEWTPLMIAVASHAEMTAVDQLIKQGASVQAKNILDVSATDIATFNQDHDILQYLTEVHDVKIFDVAEDATNVFLEAASAGDVHLLQHLYDSGTPVRAENLGTQALLNAARNGHNEVVTLLLDWGVDANAQDASTGLTPLEYARINDHIDTVRLLSERGASEFTFTSASPECGPIQDKGKFRTLWGRFLNRFRRTHEAKDAEEDATDETPFQASHNFTDINISSLSILSDATSNKTMEISSVKLSDETLGHSNNSSHR